MKILALLENRAGNDIAESAGLMFFRGDDDMGFFSGTHERGDIQRLHGMYIHDAGFDGVLLLQEPRGAHRFGNHGTTGNDRDVFLFVLVCGT